MFWSAYLLVFIISFFLRCIVSFLFLPRIKERRQVENISYPQLLFDSLNIMPTVAWAGVTVSKVTGTMVNMGNKTVAEMERMMHDGINYTFYHKKKEINDKASTEDKIDKNNVKKD